jgi:hypothetical protein
MWVVKLKTSPSEVPGFAADDETVEAVQDNVATWQRRELP